MRWYKRTVNQGMQTKRMVFEKGMVTVLEVIMRVCDKRQHRNTCVWSVIVHNLLNNDAGHILLEGGNRGEPPRGPRGPQSSSSAPPPLLFLACVFHSEPSAELMPCDEVVGEIGEIARDRGGVGSFGRRDSGPRESIGSD